MAAKTERRQPRRLVRRELDGPFAGWWFEYDADFTLRQMFDLQSGDLERRMKAYGEVVSGWNFVGKDGRALALPEGIWDVGIDLLVAMTAALNQTAEVPAQTEQEFRPAGVAADPWAGDHGGGA